MPKGKFFLRRRRDWRAALCVGRLAWPVCLVLLVRLLDERGALALLGRALADREALMLLERVLCVRGALVPLGRELGVR